MSARTSPQFPTWTFYLSSCFLGLLTIVLRDRKIPSQDTQIWKVLLLHIQKFAITFMNLEVPIGCLKIHMNCLITDILLLETSSRDLSMCWKHDLLFSKLPLKNGFHVQRDIAIAACVSKMGDQSSYFFPHKYIICTSPGAQSKLVNLE